MDNIGLCGTPIITVNNQPNTRRSSLHYKIQCTLSDLGSNSSYVECAFYFIGTIFGSLFQFDKTSTVMAFEYSKTKVAEMKYCGFVVECKMSHAVTYRICITYTKVT